MHTKTIHYHHEAQELHGFIAYDAKDERPRPAVLVVHDWSGRNAFACEKAVMLAEMGYVGFAVDMYGEGRLGDTTAEKMALMQPFIAKRDFLALRIRAAYDALLALSVVDKERIAVIGFCFGGLCALDLARSGAKLRGVVSFHGLLHKPEDLPKKPIHASMLILNGYDDPMVTPTQVNQFCQEMTDAGVDWQVHQYGGTQHAFTNPEAHDASMGTVYNDRASIRAHRSMANFLEEILI